MAKRRTNRSGSLFQHKGKGNWIAMFHLHTGKRVKWSTGVTDKRAADRIMQKWIVDEELRRNGVIDTRLEAFAIEEQKPLKKHLDELASAMRARHRSQQHIKQTIDAVLYVAKSQGWVRISQIDEDGLNRCMDALKERGRNGKPSSSRLIQFYMGATKYFARRLYDKHKLPFDPLSGVQKPSADADRRRYRRMLLPDEWPLIVKATLASPVRFGMDGASRFLLYAVAIQTGLRSGELRSLQRNQLSLDGDSPYVTCKAANTKNKQGAKQYITTGIAAKLKVHVLKLPHTTRSVFAMPRKEDVADMLRADLAAARAEWLKDRTDADTNDFLLPVNADGETLDFHSLRHTCGAWLAMKGVYPTIIQKIMRHCTITLTLGTYGHLMPGEVAHSVADTFRGMDE